MTLPSPHKSNTSGLPQGAVLSTTLFTLYLPDMPRPPHAHLVFYADDTVFVSQAWQPDTISHRLGFTLTTLHKYVTKWKLRLNTHKTETILFSKRPPASSLSLPGPIHVRETSVPWVPYVHHLGLMFDCKLLSAPAHRP
jgi:hypothetical protein